LDRRLGGPQSRSGRGGEEKNPQLLPGLESPIVQPVAQRCTAELSKFLSIPIDMLFNNDFPTKVKCIILNKEGENLPDDISIRTVPTDVSCNILISFVHKEFRRYVTPAI
jgi:hypothetical protein